MWNVIEQLAVALAITALKLAIKNPGAIKTEGAIIAQVASVATQADTLANGTVWTSTPGTPPAAPAA